MKMSKIVAVLTGPRFSVENLHLFSKFGSLPAQIRYGSSAVTIPLTNLPSDCSNWQSNHLSESSFCTGKLRSSVYQGRMGQPSKVSGIITPSHYNMSRLTRSLEPQWTKTIIRPFSLGACYFDKGNRDDDQKGQPSVPTVAGKIVRKADALKALNVDEIKGMSPVKLWDPERNMGNGEQSENSYNLTADQIETRTVEDYIEKMILDRSHGALFAIIQVTDKQFKISAGDIIIVQGYWAPRVGDQLTFDKILMVGCADFAVIGTPMVKKGSVIVKATVIAKSLSYTKLHYILLKRKNFRRMKFYKTPYTKVRINSIEIELEAALKDVE